MRQEARPKYRMQLRLAVLLAVPISLFSLSSVKSQVLIEPAPAPIRMKIDLSECPDQGAADEITVCGRRDDQERYRLPLRGQDGSASGQVRGEVPRASAEANPTAPCGIFEGERRCSKAEMRRYGYRNPLTALREVTEGSTDPD